MTDQRDLETERAELTAKIEAAECWGAAVGARGKRIKQIDRQLAATDSARPSPFTFRQEYPGGRILLLLGQHQAGAVFLPAQVTTLTRPDWHWRWWLGDPTATRDGRAKSEQAARNALLAHATDWVRQAGLVTQDAAPAPDVAALVKALDRLGSAEGMVSCMIIRDNMEGCELKARMAYARAELAKWEARNG